jgi:hypothetical protein
MTYLEYMMDHGTENLSWCRPYTNDDETYFLIMYDGEALEIHAPGYEGHRYDGTLRIYMEQFARELAGDNYDLYSGYTDEQIALEYLHECGCASCPARHVCEAMNETMEDA